MSCIRNSLLIIFIGASFVLPSFALHAGQWDKIQPFAAVNSAADDFGLVVNPVDSTLCFLSARNGTTQLFAYHPSTAILEQSPLLQPAQRRSQISYMTVNRKGEMYYSAFRHTKRQSYLNLMTKNYSGGVWSEAQFAEILNSDSFTAHPTLSPSGNTIVFVSDRPGGEGGTDMWISTRSAGIWNTPVNLGEIINSRENEITPYLSNDDTLYFSSNGLGGKGGYEIFMTVNIAGEWQPPLAVEEVNSGYDESDFVLLPDGSACFASTRPGGKGGLDFYLAQQSGVLSSNPTAKMELAVQLQTREITIERNTALKATVLPQHLLFADSMAEQERMQSEIVALAKLLRSKSTRYPTLHVELIGYAADEGQKELVQQRLSWLQQRLGQNGNSGSATISTEVQIHAAFAARNGRIDIRCTDPRALEPESISEDKFAVYPEELVMLCDVRPRENVQNWSVYVECGKERVPADQGMVQRLPVPIRVALTHMKNAMLSNDSLTIEMNTWSSAGVAQRSRTGIAIQRRSVVLAQPVADTLSLDLIADDESFPRQYKAALAALTKAPELSFSIRYYSAANSALNEKAKRNAFALQDALRMLGIPAANISIQPVSEVITPMMNAYREKSVVLVRYQRAKP